MDGKCYARNTVIAFYEGRKPAPQGSSKPFRETADQAEFFSRATDLLFNVIRRRVRSDLYLIVDALVFVIHQVYLHLASKGKHYQMKLYATPKGFRRQAAVLNSLLSYSEVIRIACMALKDWEPVKVPDSKRKEANRAAQRFLNWINQVRREERRFHLDAWLTVFHRATVGDKALRKAIRTGKAGLFRSVPIDVITTAMDEAVGHLSDSIKGPKISEHRHANVSSGFYRGCRKRIYDSMQHLTIVEQYLMLESIPMLMNDLGIWFSRASARYGCNHMLMAINATGRMEEFLSYFEERAKRFNRKYYGKKKYDYINRRIGSVWSFIGKHTSAPTTFADIDVIRAVRAKTRRAIDKASSSDVRDAIMELKDEIKGWRTLRSLNVSCK
jgi:hypothetical protein